MAKRVYWDQYQSKVSRRRVLLTSGVVLAGGAVWLTGCGNGDHDSNGSSGSNASQRGAAPGSGASGSSGSPSILYTPVDTTSQAQHGGVLKDAQTSDVTSFDMLTTQANATEIVAGFVASRLLKMKYGLLQPATGEVEGDAAKSFEISADQQQLTFKLRPELKWDQRPPTSSRPVDADDVVFSWNKFASLHPFRGNLSNAVNPDASIVSITAPDKSTVVVKLAFPDGAILGDLASTAFLFVQPRESESA